MRADSGSAELVEFGGPGIAVAEFGLDRPQLLAEVELLLVLREFRLDLVLDLRAELEELDLPIEDGRQTLHAGAYFEGVQQVLLLLDRDVEVRRDQVGHLAGILDVHHDQLQLVGQVGNHRDELRELVDEVGFDRIEVLR